MNPSFPSESDSSIATDIKAIERAWLNEKSSPTILPFITHVVDRLFDAIIQQEENIQILSKSVSKRLINILNLELSRIKTYLREYHRVRILKIQKYSLHILSDSTLRDRLSASETKFAEAYADILSNHFYDSFLKLLPEDLQDLLDSDSNELDTKAIPKPRLSTYIYCKALQDVKTLKVSGTSFSMRKGDVFLLPFNDALSLLIRKCICLI